ARRQSTARRPRPRRSSHRWRTGSPAARLPARRREIGRRPVCNLSRAGRRRSPDARDFREDPARRGVSYELHLHAADSYLAAGVSTARVACTRQAIVEPVSARRRCRRGADGQRAPDTDVLRTPAAVRVARQARRAARTDWLDSDLAHATQRTAEPVLT